MTKSQSMAILGMFAAIIFLLAFTPLGFVPIPFFGRATTLHIPVIIGSLFLGPKYGAVLGFMFGMASFLVATTQPGITSFAFSPFVPVPGTGSGTPWALLIAFVPRIFVGIVPWYVYTGLQKLTGKRFVSVAMGISGLAGSLTNTVLVLHFIYFLVWDSWVQATNAPMGAYAVILGAIASVGVPEAVVAAILVAAIGSALKVAFPRLKTV